MYTVNQLGQPVVKMDFSNSVEFIRETTLTASGSITWDNIPQDYNHLWIIGRARDTSAGIFGYAGLRFNNDTGTNYWNKYVQGYGTGGAVTVGVNNLTLLTGGLIPGNTSSANYFGAVEHIIPNYNQSGYYKSVLSRGSNFGTSVSTTYARAAATGEWANTSVITRIDLVANSQYAAGTTFSLYGIRNIENRALGDLTGERARFRGHMSNGTTFNMANVTFYNHCANTVDYDNYGGWDNTNREYTIPRTGIYHINSKFLLSSYALAANYFALMSINVNGSAVITGSRMYYLGTGTSAYMDVGAEYTLLLSEGDILTSSMYQSTAATRSIYNSASTEAHNYIAIHEIGV